jgi:hypothetical protein
VKPMTVTPETMAQDGQTLIGVADDMASGLSGLQGTVQGDGNPWGSDEQGSLFGVAYQLVLGKAFEAITSHVEQVGYAGQALVAQAGGYDQVETGTSQQLRTLAPEG